MRLFCYLSFSFNAVSLILGSVFQRQKFSFMDDFHRYIAKMKAKDAFQQSFSLPKINRTQYPTLYSCYYTYYPGDKSQPQPDQIDAKLCTHVIVFGGSVKNGSLVAPNKTWTDGLMSLKERNPKLKLLLCIGGAGVGGFDIVIQSNSTMEKFANEITKFLQLSGFDGIDFDWEFPSTKQRPGFTQILRHVRSRMNQSTKRQLILTAAVSADFQIADDCCEIPELNKYLDFINLMCYDFHMWTKFTPFVAFNAPLFKKWFEISLLGRFNTAYAAYYWYKQGMDHRKILVGIPTYGRGYTLAIKFLNYPYAPSTGISKKALGAESDFPFISKIINNGYTKVWDDEAQVPYAYKGSDWWTYEDPHSAANKARWIMSQNFRGAMVFDFNSDDWRGQFYNGTRAPIMQAVHDVLFKKN